MQISDGRLRLSASDVANFLACRHLTRLDLLKARHQLQPPETFDLGFEELVRRGIAHEQQILDEFSKDGLQITGISSAPGAEAEAASATLDAMRSGAEIIYQGVLLHQPAQTPPAGDEHARDEHAIDRPALLGRPDFLIRADLLPAPDGEPRPAAVHYEVVDAKLARSAKARAVAQTAFYSHLLAGVQGVSPRWMHLALGNGERKPFKVDDYAAYERQARRSLTAFIAGDPGENPPTDPYPDPVEHCAICRWSGLCAARRRSDDDLSLIAGITKGQRKALKAAGVSTRRGFAALGELPAVSRAGGESLQRARLQARLQIASEDDGAIRYEILDPERNDLGELIPNRGLLALPEPTPGDLFFDIEGARYYSEDGQEFGLQYLFGVVDTAETDEAGLPRYTQIWSCDRQRDSFGRRGEKRAFEELIDFITDRRKRNPRLHVYHYNHYEPTSVDHLTELHETRAEAVGRLMGRYATREDEVDDLFRLGVFVDLYRVVRQGLRAGVESYSIKRLEPLCGYARLMDLREATRNLIAFEAALEDGDRAATDTDGEQRVIAAYNEDDCRATLALRDWLEERRAELPGRLGEDLPRPAVAAETDTQEDPEVTRIRAALLTGIPVDPAERTDEHRAKALLADLLDWHRREAKPAWWRYFYLCTLSGDDLAGEPDALGGLTGGEIVGEEKQSVIREFGFPPQEHRFSGNDRGVDPVTGKTWTICDLDDERGTIRLKVGKSNPNPLPAALIPEPPPGTRELRERLRDLGERVVREGVSGADAATALLQRLPPAVGLPPAAGTAAPAHAAPADAAPPASAAPPAVGAPAPAAGAVPARSLRREEESAGDAAVRLAVALQASYLPIQGPPGTGKTYNGARQILALIRAGRPVGITAPSHAVIHNFISMVRQQAADCGMTVRIGQRADKDNPHLHRDAQGMSNEALARALRDGELDVAAGTVWLWSRPEMAGGVDTLFVDEAGQLSLANVLAVAGAARNLILLGDPQQLAQPSQAAHPPGAGVSPLEHILSGRATMPAEAGLLLDTTWRMHPRLRDFTSQVFYDGQLTGVDGLERQQILGEVTPGDMSPGGAGLRVIAVPHEDNANASAEEAGRVAALVLGLLGRQWRDRHGHEQPIGPGEILVVTPYNAHIREIEDALRMAGEAGAAAVRVGTVDKFQGQEAPVAIYSMATSSADEAPRGLEFLYDLHRLNVATSRAKAMAVIVASPGLLRVACRTPRQMYLANALCRAWEAGEGP